jgi:NB-ARC domain
MLSERKERGRKASEIGFALVIKKLESVVGIKEKDYGFTQRVTDYLVLQLPEIKISQKTVSCLRNRTNIDKLKFEAICRLLDEDPDEISNPGVTIPRPPNLFIGRDDDLNKLEELVLIRKVRLIYLKGIPGIGKKSLVSQLIEKKLRNELTVWVNFSYNEPKKTLLADLVYKLSLVSQKEVNKGNRSDEAILWEYLKFKRYVIILNHDRLGNSQESPHDLDYEEFMDSLCSSRKEKEHQSSIILITDRKIGSVFTRAGNINLCSVQTMEELKIPDGEKLLKSKFSWDNHSNEFICEYRDEIIKLLASKIGHPLLLTSTADYILRYYSPKEDNFLDVLSKEIQEVFLPDNLHKIIHQNLKTLSEECRIILRLFEDDDRMSLASIQSSCYEKGLSIFGFQRAFKDIQNLSLLCNYKEKNSQEDVYGLGETVKPLISKYLESHPD